MRFLHSALLCSFVALPAIGQVCTPTWDTSAGTPGTTTGYVGAFTKYQGSIVATGSFTEMAGVAGSSYVAAYDTGTDTWSPLSNGLTMGIGNAFGTSFAEYNGDLYIGGSYAFASSVPDTRAIARFDGTSFHSLGTGWGPDTVNAVWSMYATSAIGGQNRLYFAGTFDTVAGQTAGSVAMWDGTTITPIATSMTIVGINPYVPAMTVFNDGQGGGDQLYIGGRFTTVDGVTAPMIARWNGTTWSPVGTNLTPRNATADIDCFLAYDDGTGLALYAGGSNLRVNADGINRSVVKWDGLTWSAVGQYVGGRTWSLAAFDDGNGTKLYGGGTLPASGYLYRMDTPNTWTTIGTGGNASVFNLFVDGDTLWIGGSFATMDGQSSNRIIARRACVNTTCDAIDFNGDGLFPDTADIDDFLSVFSGGPCSTGTCGDIDFNNDGLFPDTLDIDSLLSVFSGGACL